MRIEKHADLQSLSGRSAWVCVGEESVANFLFDSGFQSIWFY